MISTRSTDGLLAGSMTRFDIWTGTSAAHAYRAGWDRSNFDARARLASSLRTPWQDQGTEHQVDLMEWVSEEASVGTRKVPLRD